MAAATVANHIATSTVSPPPVVGRTTEEVNATHTPEAVPVTTDISNKQLRPAVAATIITTTSLNSNNNNTNIENMERDEYTESSISNSISSSTAPISPMGTPILASKVATTPTLIHPHKAMLTSTKTPNLPPVAMPGPLNCEGDTESANEIPTCGVSMASIQLVDNSTQTDIPNEEETLTENVELYVNAEVESEQLRQAILTVPQNPRKNHKFTKAYNKGSQDVKVALTAKRQNGIENYNENVLQAELLSSDSSSASEENRLECSESSVFSDKLKNGISESITDIDCSSIETSVDKNSVDEKTLTKLKNSKLSSEYGEYEPVDCICNAATQFDCECDETTANCTYQERIIDYDNFRIIEHVIDCAHESYCNHNDAWKTNYEDNIDESKDINFACRELVAFIGESYQIIDNAQRSLMQAQGQTENSKGEASDMRTESPCSVKDVEDKDIHIKDLLGPRTLPVEKVDDNNNKDRTTSAIHHSSTSDDGNTNHSNKTLKTSAIAVTSSSPIIQHTKPVQRSQKLEETPSTMQLPAPSVALALKALKSKLTPLAPSFHPARKKIPTTSSATATTAAATSSVYAYEQTAIYYQPQSPQSHPPPPKQQQQQQQQQLLQHTTTTTRLHTMSLHQHSRAQQDKQQSPQVSPMSQQSYSKSTFQHQRKQLQQYQSQPLQHIMQQANNFLSSSATHQQHCAQHGNPLGGMPHIHLHSAAGSAAVPPGTGLTTSALPVAVGNASQQSQLYPLQVISLAGSGAVATAGNSNGVAATQQQQSNTTSEVGNGHVAWPLLEATPIFIDANGEFRTFCPTHGPPTMNPTGTVGAANSNAIQFSHSAATNLSLENITQNSQSQHYKHPTQHHQAQLLSTLPVPSSTSILAVGAPALSINATNRQLSQQQQQKHQVQTKNQNHNKNHHQHHHQLAQQQQHQHLETSNGTPQISGKGKPYRGE